MVWETEVLVVLSGLTPDPSPGGEGNWPKVDSLKVLAAFMFLRLWDMPKVRCGGVGRHRAGRHSGHREYAQGEGSGSDAVQPDHGF